MLVMDRLCKQFPSAKGGAPIRALQDLSLSVAEGEYVCLLGRSGCGKSTLLAVIAGLLAPDSGRITCNGQDIRGPDRHRMLMFQDAALFPWLDVRGNVLYGLQFVEGLSQAEKRMRADAHIELVGLSRFRHLRVHELSGGMRQRAALARALAPDPDILMMDEPFSALDAMTREQLYDDMQRIWKETRKTILMVTHNAREAACLGNRIVVLDAPGRIVADEAIDLPYPRGMNDAALAITAARITGFLPKGGMDGGGPKA